MHRGGSTDTDKMLAHMIPTISPKEKRNRKRIGKETSPYNTQDIEKLRSGTALAKRQCLTLLMANYDPCGLMSPVLLTGKMLMHNIAGSEHEWDEPLPKH